MGTKMMIAEITYGDCIGNNPNLLKDLENYIEVWKCECETHLEIREEDFYDFYENHFKNGKNTMDNDFVEMIEKLKKEFDRTSKDSIRIEIWR